MNKFHDNFNKFSSILFIFETEEDIENGFGENISDSPARCSRISEN